MKEKLRRLILKHLAGALSTPPPTSRNLLRSQSGQAVIEYILVLVVVVGIALGIMYQLNTAFKKYVNNYFGEYVACLLETGEMPSLGGDGGANSDTCNSAFEPFSLKNGRPLVANAGGDSGGGGDRSKSRYSKSASPSGARGSNVKKNGAALNAERAGASGSVAATTDKNGKKVSRKSSNVTSGNFRFKTARMGGNEQIRLDRKFVMGDDDKKKNTPPLVKTLSAKNPNARLNRKLALSMDKFKFKERVEEPEVNLSAGDYLRYILIFAIIVGIIVFFGGQLNQLRKNWDSN